MFIDLICTAWQTLHSDYNNQAVSDTYRNYLSLYWDLYENSNAFLWTEHTIFESDIWLYINTH